ncbi:hypothetical protein G6F68_018725 [Rhizopus microsporus]|nr:hypothetical protein G6F68_018725 [Rhizopus microsporus]
MILPAPEPYCIVILKTVPLRIFRFSSCSSTKVTLQTMFFRNTGILFLLCSSLVKYMAMIKGVIVFISACRSILPTASLLLEVWRLPTHFLINCHPSCGAV